MCVCARACMYVSVCVWCVHVCVIYAYICICVNVCVSARERVRVSECVSMDDEGRGTEK